MLEENKKYFKQHLSDHYMRKLKNNEMTEQEANEIINNNKLKDFLKISKYNEMRKLKLNLKEYIDYIDRKAKNFKLKSKYETLKRKTRLHTIYFMKNCDGINKVCQVCGSNKDIETHHQDYNEPYKVHFLCKKHHNDMHNHDLHTIPIINLEEYKRS